MTNFSNMSLADRFIAAGGAPIEFQGELAYWTYWIGVHTGSVVELQFLHCRPSPVQGMVLHAERCRLEAEGATGKAMVFWADTGPPRARIYVLAARSEARIGVYNVWRDPKYGSTMARLNNASMRVEKRDDFTRLRCSDGWGDATFDDLVVEISLLRNTDKKFG